MSHLFPKISKWFKTLKKRGFTLLEILLVVGIIAILAGIVIVAINPGRQLALVRNTERKSDLKQINNAIQQYYIDNHEYPATVTVLTDLTEICNTGTASSSILAGVSCGTLVDLSSLVPEYITAIPVDPSGSETAFLDKIISTVYAGTNGTGYWIEPDQYNKIIVVAPQAELEAFIAIGTTTAIALPSQNQTPTCASFIYTWNTCVNGTQTPASVTASPNGCIGGTPLTSQGCSVTPDVYTVTFDSQTATVDANSESMTVTSPATNVGTLPAEPNRNTGFSFGGWYTGTNGSGTPFIGSTPVNANVTVYAKWTDTQAPAVTFTIPSTASSLTINISTFTATDNVGVTAYLITESSSTPSVNNSGWAGTATTTFTCSSSSVTTLYAWAKDVAGNISSYGSGPVAITISSGVWATSTSGLMDFNPGVAACTAMGPGWQLPSQTEISDALTNNCSTYFVGPRYAASCTGGFSGAFEGYWTRSPRYWVAYSVSPGSYDPALLMSSDTKPKNSGVPSYVRCIYIAP